MRFITVINVASPLNMPTINHPARMRLQRVDHDSSSSRHVPLHLGVPNAARITVGRVFIPKKRNVMQKTGGALAGRGRSPFRADFPK